MAEIAERSPITDAAGTLSASEVALAPEARATDPDATEAFRDAYAKAIQRANDARDKLRERLHKGLPELKPTASGGTDGMHLIRHAQVRDLIDAHVRAQRWLWKAAEQICDAENLPEDGYAQGIVWETPLYTKPEPEAA